MPQIPWRPFRAEAGRLGGSDATVRVWDLATGAPVGDPFTAPASKGDASHYGGAIAVAVTELGGRPVAVASSWDSTIGVWDLATGAPVGDPFAVDTIYFFYARAGAVAELDGHPVVVVSGPDSTVHVLDLASGAPVGDPFAGHAVPVKAVAAAELDGRPVVVSGSADATVRVWDPATGAPVGDPFTGHASSVTTMAIAELDGRPVVVSADLLYRNVLVWDLASGEPVCDPISRDDLRCVEAVATAELDGRPVVVSFGEYAISIDGSEPGRRLSLGGRRPVSAVWVWDLASGAPIGQPFTSLRRSGDAPVAVAELDGRPVAICGFEDGTVLVLDLATGVPIGQRLEVLDGIVTAVCVATVNNQPMLFAGTESGTVAAWRLGEVAPRRHARIARLLRSKKATDNRWQYGRPVHALAHGHHANQLIVGHGSAIAIQGTSDTRVIELDATVSALATASSHLIVVATIQGIVALDVP